MVDSCCAVQEYVDTKNSRIRLGTTPDHRCVRASLISEATSRAVGMCSKTCVKQMFTTARLLRAPRAGDTPSRACALLAASVVAGAGARAGGQRCNAAGRDSRSRGRSDARQPPNWRLRSPRSRPARFVGPRSIRPARPVTVRMAAACRRHDPGDRGAAAARAGQAAGRLPPQRASRHPHGALRRPPPSRGRAGSRRRGGVRGVTAAACLRRPASAWAKCRGRAGARLWVLRC